MRACGGFAAFTAADPHKARDLRYEGVSIRTLPSWVPFEPRV
jgi:hypothetical protein